MKIEDIKPGNIYEINYVDPHYPCSCDCHNEESKVLHVSPCCYDSSYNGAAVCIAKHHDLLCFRHLTVSGRYYVVQAESVVKDHGPFGITIQESTQIDAMALLGVETKQVIVMRKDLKMRRGKEIAQGAHSSMAFLTDREGPLSLAAQLWIQTSFTKIVCKVNSEEELVDIAKRARNAELTTHVITDSGRTEFGGVPTMTCCAIGPDFSEVIDKITGDLELY